MGFLGFPELPPRSFGDGEGEGQSQTAPRAYFEVGWRATTASVAVKEPLIKLTAIWAQNSSYSPFHRGSWAFCFSQLRLKWKFTKFCSSQSNISFFNCGHTHTYKCHNTMRKQKMCCRGQGMTTSDEQKHQLKGNPEWNALFALAVVSNASLWTASPKQRHILIYL